MSFLENLTSLMSKGGPVMWIILICSLISTFIIVERLLFFHRSQINIGDFIQGILNNLRKNNVAEAVSICDDTPGPTARVLRAAILRGEEDAQFIEKAVEESYLEEIPKLESNLNLLVTVAHITPLLGLLGTVVGMIGAFQTIEEGGTSIIVTALSGDIWKALITSAAGLTVAIPSYAFYNLLVTKVESFVNEMEAASSEIIFFLSRNKITIDSHDKNQPNQAQQE